MGQIMDEMKESVKRKWKNSFDLSESYDESHPETSLNLSNEMDNKSICMEDLDEDWYKAYFFDKID